MLIQDNVSGTIEEVPDFALYENDPTVYNGLGDPVGLLPGLIPGLPNPFDLIKGAVSTVSNLIRPPAPPPMAMPPPMAVPPPAPFFPGMPPGFPSMMPQFRPPGWMTPPSPYQGPHPRRLYMRCATWRGPAGLVPQNPEPWPTPPQQPQVPPPGAAQPVMRRRGGFRGRRFRRVR